MDLEEFDVLERDAGPQTEGHAVAGVDQRVGRLAVHAGCAARGNKPCPAGEIADGAVAAVEGEKAEQTAIFYDERKNVPLVVNDHPSLDALFIEGVEQGMAGFVGHIAGAVAALPAEGALGVRSLRGSAEMSPPSVQGVDGIRGLPGEDSHRILVSEKPAICHQPPRQH